MPIFPVNKICIVDDDDDFAALVSDYLTLRGFSAVHYNSAENVLRLASLNEFDFFVLDLGLPGLDGVDLTAMIRARSEAGILVVSGRMGADAFNSALVAGADMFINKPVRFDQVYHSLISISRRTSTRPNAGLGWSVAADYSELRVPNGQVVKLTHVEGSLLQALRTAEGRAVSRATLVQAAGLAASADHRNLDAAIFRLRRKIEQETGEPSPFRTVHGLGYQLSADVPMQGDPDR